MSTSGDQQGAPRGEGEGSEDDVDEMAEETFPASDPPANAPGDED